MNNKPLRIKIITMGNAEVGKSCIVKRYCEKRFVNKYLQTIGIDYGVTKVDIRGKEIKVNIFDFGGHPAFMEVRNEFYKDCQGALLVYDVTDSTSFRSLEKWCAELRADYGDLEADGLQRKQFVCIVCGNKIDRRRMVSEADGRSWAEQKGFRYFETSALNGENINEVFQTLFDLVVTVVEGGVIQPIGPANMQTSFNKEPPQPSPSPRYTQEQEEAVERVRAAMDNYERLGLKRGILTRDEIDRNYRRLAVLLHPDKNPAPGSEEAFKLIAAARSDLLKFATQ